MARLSPSLHWELQKADTVRPSFCCPLAAQLICNEKLPHTLYVMILWSGAAFPSVDQAWVLSLDLSNFQDDGFLSAIARCVLSPS